MNESSIVHVAVGVIVNDKREVLVAWRASDKHQGGCWEFPGGKVENAESVIEALARELKEEIDIEVTASAPLLTIDHDYGDKRVTLEVRLVEHYSGEARGRQGQNLRWVGIDALAPADFPAANATIIRHLQADR